MYSIHNTGCLFEQRTKFERDGGLRHLRRAPPQHQPHQAVRSQLRCKFNSGINIDNALYPHDWLKYRRTGYRDSG